MAGKQISVHRVVRADPESVWAVLTDLENACDTLRGVIRIDVVEGDGYAVGTRWRETRKLFGMEETQEMYVTAVERPRRTTVEADSGAHYTTEYLLEPVEDGTDLRVTFGAHHPDPNLLQRLTFAVFGQVGARVTTRMLAQDLSDIARRAEAAEADGTTGD